MAPKFEREDRLPLKEAVRQTQGVMEQTFHSFLGHVFEVWLFGQHTYWSVGRGLAGQRGGGKILLRLRVVLDEGGWTLTPGPMPPGLPDR